MVTLVVIISKKKNDLASQKNPAINPPAKPVRTRFYIKKVNSNQTIVAAIKEFYASGQTHGILHLTDGANAGKFILIRSEKQDSPEQGVVYLELPMEEEAACELIIGDTEFGQESCHPTGCEDDDPIGVVGLINMLNLFD